MGYTDTQLDEAAEAIVKAVRGIGGKPPVWDQPYFVKLVDSLPNLGELKSGYDELMAVINGEGSEVEKKKATELYLRRIHQDVSKVYGIALEMIPKSDACYKTAKEKGYQTVLGMGFPLVAATRADLGMLVKTWGDEVTIKGHIIDIEWQNVLAIKFDKIRKVYPKIKLVLNMTKPPTNGGFTIIAPGTGNSKLGFTSQPHPHILGGGGLCMGTVQEPLSNAFAEGRVFDVAMLVRQLMEDPKESKEHVPTLAGVPGTEFQCDKCGKWETYKTHKDGRWNMVPGGDHGVKDSKFMCLGCVVKCPVTGKALVKMDDIKVVDGVQYHVDAGAEVKGKWYLKTLLTTLPDGTLAVTSELKTCFLSGVRGMSTKPPAEPVDNPVMTISPLDLIELEGGKHVAVGCVDLINENGEFINPFGAKHGTEAAKSARPWWFGRIDTQGWSYGSRWRDAIIANYNTATKAGQTA